MGLYSNIAFRLFGPLSESLAYYLADIRSDLKKAGLKVSVQEYLSEMLLTTSVFFAVSTPILAFVFAYLIKEFLFAFITSFTISIVFSVIIFTLFLNWPKFIMKGRAKEIEDSLPFASLYIATVAGSRLPLFKTFEIFAKYSTYGEITKEVGDMVNDIKSFGLDLNAAIERQIERTPSKKFTELLWGILSVIRAGADVAVYLKEKSNTAMADYRRKITEFSRTLTLYIELYLTSIVLGTIFFTILTSIIAGIGGAQGNVIFLQFMLIFILLPVVSIVFIFLIKSATPGGE